MSERGGRKRVKGRGDGGGGDGRKSKTNELHLRDLQGRERSKEEGSVRRCSLIPIPKHGSKGERDEEEKKKNQARTHRLKRMKPSKPSLPLLTNPLRNRPNTQTTSITSKQRLPWRDLVQPPKQLLLRLEVFHDRFEDKIGGGDGGGGGGGCGEAGEDEVELGGQGGGG